MTNSTGYTDIRTRVGFRQHLAYGDKVSSQGLAQGGTHEVQGDGEFEPSVMELFQRLDDSVQPLTGLSDPRVKRIADELIRGKAGRLPDGFQDMGGTDPQGRASQSALLRPSFPVDQHLTATVREPGVVGVKIGTYASEQEPTAPGLFRALQIIEGEFRDGVLDHKSVSEHLDLGYLIAGG